MGYIRQTDDGEADFDDILCFYDEEAGVAAVKCTIDLVCETKLLRELCPRILIRYNEGWFMTLLARGDGGETNGLVRLALARQGFELGPDQPRSKNVKVWVLSDKSRFLADLRYGA